MVENIDSDTSNKDYMQRKINNIIGFIEKATLVVSLGFDMLGTSAISLKEIEKLENVTLDKLMESLKQTITMKKNSEISIKNVKQIFSEVVDLESIKKEKGNNDFDLKDLEENISMPKVFEEEAILNDFAIVSNQNLSANDADPLLIFLSKTRLTLFSERSNDVVIIELYHGNLPIYVLKDNEKKPFHYILKKDNHSDKYKMEKVPDSSNQDNLGDILESYPEDKLEFRLFLVITLEHGYDEDKNNVENTQKIMKRKLNNVAALVGVFSFRPDGESQKEGKENRKLFEKLLHHITDPEAGFYIDIESFFSKYLGVKDKNIVKHSGGKEFLIEEKISTSNQNANDQNANDQGDKLTLTGLQFFMIFLAWYFVARPMRKRLLKRGKLKNSRHPALFASRFFHSIFDLRNSLFHYSLGLVAKDDRLLVSKSVEFSDGRYILRPDSDLSLLLAYIFHDYLDIYSERVELAMRIKDSIMELCSSTRVDIINQTILYDDWIVNLEPERNVRVDEDRIDLYKWQLNWDVSWGIFITAVLSILSQTMILMNKRIDRYLMQYERVGFFSMWLRGSLAFEHLHEIMADGAKDFSDFFNIDILQNDAYNQLFETFKETSGVNRMYERMIERIRMFGEYEAHRRLHDLTIISIVLTVVLVVLTLLTALPAIEELLRII
ncbi:hypothetical protein SJAV_27480 [Sulfurisphaera javensis]|uniref:Uncharacterized protein n=1 Tax=Sulfurisphaera javensis TaxID=2049879 RepID=A0AAT9GV87_9CREN